MLILFDIDGTLLLGTPQAHTEALARAAAEVFAVPATAHDVVAISPGGRTDQEIARLVLRRHGVDDEAISAGLPEWKDRAAALYPDVAPRHAPQATAPGAAEALARTAGLGATLSLLTGNLEPIAHAKLDAGGLGGWFPPGVGAFGSDHEVRDALVPIAVERAGGLRPAVVVGDTPRDVACARAGGALCIGVTTGIHHAATLHGADAVVPALLDAVDVLDAWMRDGVEAAPL